MKEEFVNALAILRRAKQIEQEGHKFYLKASQITQDEKGRETFISLADDEQKHFNLIQRQFESLRHERRWAGSPEVKPKAIDLNTPLFPKDREVIEKAITAKSSERDALLFGLEIENKSYDLYRKAASQTADPLGRDMFEFLAGEERGHFDILMMRYDFLFGPIAWSA